jgi:hypothetical protein
LGREVEGDAEQCTTSTTSGVSYSGGAGIGWNETQGLNAVLTGGVSIDNSPTIICPQTTIVNQTDPGNAEPAWTYEYPFPSSTQLQTFYNQWIWMVPFENYSTGQSTIQVSSNAELCYHTDSCPNLTASLQSTAPLPFGDVFALEKPVVLSLTPTCANAGDTFTITGTGMYPSLVKSVLIDGSPLDPASTRRRATPPSTSSPPTSRGSSCRWSSRRRRATPTTT